MATHPAISSVWLSREPDPIDCACGCGASLERLDRHGRERRFKHGHNLIKYSQPDLAYEEWRDQQYGKDFGP